MFAAVVEAKADSSPWLPWLSVPWFSQWRCTKAFYFQGINLRRLWSWQNPMFAAATAKSLQSCPTLCDPIDGSPPGFPSLGFSRQEHWSGFPFPSPMHESEVAQSCPTLSDPMDYSPPGSSVHGIFQARVLEWGAITFSQSHVYFVLTSQKPDWLLKQQEGFLGVAGVLQGWCPAAFL